jgi:mycofactocin precursor
MPTDVTTADDIDREVDAEAAAQGQDHAEALVTDELLVEEVSIDGMCGVY